MPVRSLSLLAIGVVLSLVGALLDLPGNVARAAAARPDIVVFYTDDFPAEPARLWDGGDRTPELTRFTRNGLEFENAIVSSPMCGPSRATILTGRYSHDHGVTANDIRPYRQSNGLSPRLRRSGYETVFIGKHINGLAKRHPTRRAMHRLSDDWDRFDVIWENGGRYQDWRQYRKHQTRNYRKAGFGHSTYQATQRAVHHITNTPKGKPLFLMLSLYDGHVPLTPMARFKNDPRCADIGTWASPAYSEADVSDKPQYVRETPALGSSGHHLEALCRQSLTLDWAVGKVRGALRKTGRIDQTLQILTSDNGYLLGDHRLKGKSHAYSTPVPLFMRWPAVLGDSRRIVRDPVSNVDFGKTVCELAGCTLSSSPGRSLVPLISGTTSQLARNYLYVEMLNGTGCKRKATYPRPVWSGVETTLGYSSKLWAYTRYATGERELYDLSSDPYRLENLAGRSAFAAVEADLEGFRQQEWDGDEISWCT